MLTRKIRGHSKMKKNYDSPKLELDRIVEVIKTSAEVETEKIPFYKSGASSVGYNSYVDPDNFELDV